MNNSAANHPTTYGLTPKNTDGPHSDVVCRLSQRCHEWLEEARSTTNNPGIQRLIDDIHDDLYTLGPIDEDVQIVVHGALQSVAAALDTDSVLLSTLTMSSLN